MNDLTKQMFHNSFERCDHQEGFFERFYEIYVGSSDEVKEKFKNTDMERQVKMLRDSFYTTKLATGASSIIQENLKRVAALHGHRGRDIKPELYDLWLDCLIRTVNQFDLEFSFEIEVAWREMFQPGISYMKSHYDD